jgi:uncharacterized membrane protein
MDKFLTWFAETRKALIALLGTVIVLLQQFEIILPANTWVAPTIAAVTSFLVWLTPNEPQAKPLPPPLPPAA